MILTLGDSFTYGEELPSRETTAWPFLLGNMFDQQVNNLGKPGGCNDRCFRLAVEETAKEIYDLVIVAWTDPGRHELYCNGDFKTLLPNAQPSDPREQWHLDFYKYGYSDRCAHRRWYVKMLALQEYFKSIGQKYLYVTVDKVHEYLTYYNHCKHVLDKIDLTYATTWPDQGFLSWQGDCHKGPNGHPLELGHQRIANKIASYIRDLNLL